MEDDVKTLKTSTLTFSIREPKEVRAEKTIFFFALSAHDSLYLPPFCHPVDRALKEGVRVISTTLPCHENNERDYGIQEIWNAQKPALKQFLSNLVSGIEELTHFFDPPFGAMGISRGAFISLCLASASQHITTVTGFAPLLSLKDDPELNAFTKIPELKNKNIHFFVGHDDTLVGTENVISLQKKLLQINKNGNILTKISPSIGRGGHGTSDPIFNEGVLWTIKNLKTN
ncbi:MAG: hypothetical protein S4CHLAM20_03410 [Chlamydiia bacterium]|nr:hypothetical protein [Chlamydiia bacterium]